MKSSKAASGVNSSLMFRRYVPGDHEQVRHLFRLGMESAVSSAWQGTATSPVVVLVIALMALVVGWTVSLRAENIAAVVTASVFCMVVILSLIWLGISKGFENFVRKALDDDLSAPEQIQFQYGGKGAFLVVVDPDSNRIVGMVGGRFVSDKDGLSVYELRRMSVDSTYRNRGIGLQLIAKLEDELKRKSQITLVSLQRASNRLYERSGFVKPVHPTFRNWLVEQVSTFSRYEKNFDSMVTQCELHSQ
jgi:GNAT superfamily N-acetyltransferase